MPNPREEQRSTGKPTDRPAPEEAPTVLTRNPFHLAEKLNAPSPEGAPAKSPASPAMVAAADDHTHVSARPPRSSESSVSTASPLKMGMALQGEQLGHFQLEEFVGGGGMGAVFRALDTMLGRVVAVKVLSRERTDADTLRRFKNEAQSAARLDHKNIARVHYVGEDHGWNYIVFEFIDGTNVRDLIERNGPLDVDDALHFTMQIAEALDHAAQREVVHRDIKPSNIIITAASRAKLVDMGLARLHQVESSNDDITASGVTLGTFDYISPEQARDPRAADVRSDIYSLGCTLYFMLCGRPPFPEGTVLQKLLNHNSERPPDLQIFRPDVPDDIVDVVNRMLAKQPSQRYQTPAELMSELVLLAQKYQLTKVTAPVELWSETRPTEPAKWERHLPWIAPLAILLLSVVAVDYVFPTSQPDLNNLRPAAIAEPPSAPRPPSFPREAPPQPAPAPTTDAANSSNAGNSDSINDDSGNNAAEQVPTGTQEQATQEQATQGRATQQPATQDRSTANDTDSASTVGDESSTTPSDLAASTGDSETTGISASAAPPLEPVANATTGSASEQDQPSIRSTGEPIESVKATPPADSTAPNVLAISYHGESQAELFSHLQEALRKAASSATIDEIQLDFNGPLIVPTTLHIEANQLQITAAAGKQPELLFQSTAGKLSQSAMIAFRGSSLSLAGVRLTMHAPDEISPAGWTMIYGGALTQQIDIRDSVLTFDNPQADRYQEHGAAFIRLEPLPTSRSDPSETSSTVVADFTQVSLERCIVRGAATFLRSRPGQAISVQWDQGLLATSDYMLDVENMIGTPSPASMVRLSLTQVTAVAEKGLCRLGANSEASSSPLPLMVELIGCIVRTSPNAPLVDQLGVEPGSHDPDMLFDLEQSTTRFSRTRVQHRFGGIDQPELLKTDSMSWQDVPAPDAKPWHEHTSDDYLPESTASESGAPSSTPAGFDAQRLPLTLAPVEKKSSAASGLGS